MLWDEPKIFFLERRYFFSIILSEFLKNRVALHLLFLVKCVSVEDNFKERLVQFAVSVHRAAEDYLEAMLMMKEQHGYVRSIDVAEHLGVTKPSVTYATKQLKQNGFITMDRDGLITLTESGMEIADRIYTRHKTLTEFFIRIGVDEKTAREDACKVEHDLSEKTFAAICEHVAKQKDLQ